MSYSQKHGYYIGSGYMGYVGHGYRLFATESEYDKWFDEQQKGSGIMSWSEEIDLLLAEVESKRNENF